MRAVIAGASSAVTIVAVVFLVACLNTIMGAFAGWVVGLFFSNSILGTLARFGVDVADLQMWQLGAMLGFVGSSFKSSPRLEK